MKINFAVLIVFLIFLLGNSAQASAAPSAPVITHSINGLSVTISWTSVAGTSEYKLLYAPIPYTGPESIGSLNVGGVTSFSANLWKDAAFYVAVQAGNSDGFSEYSNIGEIIIASTSGDLSGNWRMTKTFGPNNCSYPIGLQYEEDMFFTQSGNSITAVNDIYEKFNGSLIGNTGSLYFSEADEYFSESQTISFTILPDNTLSGSILWKSFDPEEGESECSINLSFTAYRAPAKEE